MTKKLRKFFSSLFISVLLLNQVLFTASSAYAEDTTDAASEPASTETTVQESTQETPPTAESTQPESSPEPSPEPTPESAPIEEPETQEASSTEVSPPTPSPSPTATPLPVSEPVLLDTEPESTESAQLASAPTAIEPTSPLEQQSDPQEEQSSAGTVSNEATSSLDATASASTGDNTSISQGSSAMQTGDAVAKVDVTQVINTTVQDSNFQIYTFDITDPTQQLLNLTDLFDPTSTQSAACAVYSICGGTVSNDAEVATNVTVTAETGGNYQEGQENGLLTGDATAVANVVQLVNSEIINSQFVIVVINILVPWSGDIWFPEWFASLNAAIDEESSASTFSQNTAEVTNQIDVTADTGSNSQTAADSNQLLTGSAYASAFALQLVNSTYSNQAYWDFLVQNPALWDGSVEQGSSGLQSAASNSQATSGNQDSTQNNLAGVLTSLKVSASTGNNTQVAGKSNSMQTGSATAIANAIQLINTKWINGKFFFGVINVVDNWTGDLWVGEPPSVLPPVGGPSPDNSEGEETHSEVSTSSTTEQLPQVDIQLSTSSSVIRTGKEITFYVKLHNYSDVEVKEPILEQVIANSSNSAIGTLRFMLPQLGAGKTASFEYTMRVPQNNSIGQYNVHFYLRDASRSNLIVSNTATQQFKIIGYPKAATTLEETPATEISYSPVLGVQAAEPEMSAVKRPFSWLDPKVGLLILPLLLLCLVVVRRLRKAIAH